MEEMTDTQKLRAIPHLSADIKELYRIIVSGDPTHGQPGLLESVRNIARAIEDVRQRQTNYIELEKRVEAIEERHRLYDLQRARIDEQKKKWDAYKLAIFGTLFANLTMIILQLLGLLS